MSIRIGCSDVVNGLVNNAAAALASRSTSSGVSSAVSSAMDTEDAVSSTISSDEDNAIKTSSLDVKRSKQEQAEEPPKIVKKVFIPEELPPKKVKSGGLSKNAEQIEALLRRINEENKKTKEVLDNIDKDPSGAGNFLSHRTRIRMQDLIDDPEEEEKTKNLVNAVIPPIKTAFIEKTSTTFLGKR